MSSILKALQRVEGERRRARETATTPGREFVSDSSANPAPPPRRRTGLWLGATVAAFGVGVALATLLWPRLDPAPSPERATTAPPQARALGEPRPAQAPPTRPVPRERVALVPGERVAPVPRERAALVPPPPAAERPDPTPAPPMLRAARPAPRPAPTRTQSPPAAPNPEPAPSASPAPPDVALIPPMPPVRVEGTVWHPKAERRLATVRVDQGEPVQLHEGDAVGRLVVAEIEPSGVVFLHAGDRVRRAVGE